MKSLQSLILTIFLLISACKTSPQGQGDASPRQKTILPLPTTPTAQVESRPTLSTFMLSPPPTRSPTPADSGWQTLQPGLERRLIYLSDETGARVEQPFMMRIDPAYFTFDIAYEPTTARNLQDWQTKTGALIVINGGYFSRDEDVYRANGLIVIDGQAQGTSYGPFAGMLAITAQGPELRWLQQRPYDPAEPLLAGLQSFPILIKPGGQLGFPAEYEDNIKARRTVIGQDFQARILFLVATQGHFTLHQLSSFLHTGDLDLDIAINLDGGPSSGLLLAEPYEEIPAYSPLPLVITVHPR